MSVSTIKLNNVKLIIYCKKKNANTLLIDICLYNLY